MAQGHAQTTAIGGPGVAEVRVQYFAAARDLAGRAEETVTLEPDVRNAGDLLRALGERHGRLAPLLHRMRVAINGEFTTLDAPLADGDELALLPPVAGGGPREDRPKRGQGARLCQITTEPITADAAIAAVAHAGAGAIDLFLGIVRDHADGRAVSRLDYEAHPTLAEREMARVLEAIEHDHPGTRLAAQHRVGPLAIGDVAVVVAASAPHRAAAFDACRAAIDAIKARVPIWKQEWAADGTAHWVNLES